MRFESLMWKVVVLLVAGTVAWGSGTAQPIEDDEIYERYDGTGIIPPPSGP